MRRRSLLPAFAVGLLSVFVGGSLVMRAQESTPPPTSVGITTDLLGSGQVDAAPGMTLGARRNTFAPGGMVPPHHHPGALVLQVEAGELTYSLVEGLVQIHRAARAGTPGPIEHLAPGQEAVLRAGDWLFEQSVVHSAHNATANETVVLVVSLTAGDLPFTILHEMGTPAPK